MLSVEDHFGFTGSMLLAVAQPSGFAAWLSKDVDEAIRRLPAAGFKAKVDLSEKRQAFSDLELILGKAKFSGRIDSSQPDDAKPSVLMRLEGGELDVDGLTAFASIFVSDKGANRFSDRDLDFQIKAGPVSAGGLTADTVDTALRLRDGLLEIDRLSIGGLAGASISATGRIKDFPASPTGKLDASVVAVDLKPLIDIAAQHYPDNDVLKGLAGRTSAYPELFQDARIDLVASAADNGDGTTGLAVSGQGKAGGSAFSASLSGKGAVGQLLDAPVTLTFNAKNPDATALLALYGMPALPLGMLGQASTDISAKGTFGGGLATSFNLAADDFKATFDGTVAETPQGATAKGKIGIDASDIEPWLMTTGVGLPGMGTGTSTSLSADADFGNGLLVLSGLSGSINEAAVSGDINLDVKQGLPHLAGALALDELDLDPMAVALFGDQSFIASNGNWPTAPFSQKSSLPFTADLDLTTATLAAGPLATAYDASLSLKLDQEGIRVSDLKAKLLGGALTGLFELKNTDGTGLFSGQMKLAGADLSDRAAQCRPQRQRRFLDRPVDQRQVCRRDDCGTLRLRHGGAERPDHCRRQSRCLRRLDRQGRCDRARHRCGQDRGLCAADRRRRQFCRRRYRHRLHGCRRYAEGAAGQARKRRRGAVRRHHGGPEHQHRRRQGYDHLQARRRSAGRVGSLRQFQRRRAVRRDEEAVRQRAAGAVPDPARAGKRAAAGRGDAGSAAREAAAAARSALLRRPADRTRQRRRGIAQAGGSGAAESRGRRQGESGSRRKGAGRSGGEGQGGCGSKGGSRCTEAAKAQAEADAKAKADADAKAQAEQQAAEDAAKAEDERKKAEQAMRIASQEKARLEAERKAQEQAPKVDRSLPGVNDGSAPAPPKPKTNPFSVDNLLKSLGN